MCETKVSKAKEDALMEEHEKEFSEALERGEGEKFMFDVLSKIEKIKKREAQEANNKL